MKFGDYLFGAWAVLVCQYFYPEPIEVWVLWALPIAVFLLWINERPRQ